MPTPVTCPRCKKRRRSLWLPPRFRRGALGDWRITGSGNPLLGDGGDISIGEDCCCCITCCEPGTSPPQIELDSTSIVMNPFLGCETGCNDFADVFLLDFRNLRTTDDPETGPGAGYCLYRYCGTLSCTDADPYTVTFGWDLYIWSTGTACRAQATPWIDIADCDDFTFIGGTDATYFADLPTDPDDCCDALSSPFTLDPDPSSGANRSIVGATAGCQVLSWLANSITIQAVGC